MSKFYEQNKDTLVAERPLINTLVAEYLALTAGLSKADRLDFQRRKDFFHARFDHLTGIVRAWIAGQCIMESSRLIHDELLAALPDDDKISCDDGWRDIVDRFLSVCREQPGWLFKSAYEKWGGLELRYRCDPAGVDVCRAAETEAFNKSLETCERCGAPGRLRGNNRWRKTRCDDHARGYDD